MFHTKHEMRWNGTLSNSALITGVYIIADFDRVILSFIHSTIDMDEARAEREIGKVVDSILAIERELEHEEEEQEVTPAKMMRMDGSDSAVRDFIKSMANTNTER